MKNAGAPSDPQPESPTPRRTISEIMRDGTAIDEAMRRGVREALIRHKKLGNSIAIWRDGEAVVIPPDEIPD